jgi:hypothetical protein
MAVTAQDHRARPNDGSLSIAYSAADDRCGGGIGAASRKECD